MLKPLWQYTLEELSAKTPEDIEKLFAELHKLFDEEIERRRS